MTLPANFAGCPQEELHHHCRNAAIELKKAIKSQEDVQEIKMLFDRYLNVVRHLDWHEKTSDVYHKSESEKAVNKLVREFNRYSEGKESGNVDPKALFDSITEMEQLVQSL